MLEPFGKCPSRPIGAFCRDFAHALRMIMAGGVRHSELQSILGHSARALHYSSSGSTYVIARMAAARSRSPLAQRIFRSNFVLTTRGKREPSVRHCINVMGNRSNSCSRRLAVENAVPRSQAGRGCDWRQERRALLKTNAENVFRLGSDDKRRRRRNRLRWDHAIAVDAPLCSRRRWPPLPFAMASPGKAAATRE